MTEFLGVELAFWAWVILALLALLLEVLTLSLIGVYAALGAGAAALCALGGGATWAQVLAFAVVTLASMLVSRPYLLGRMRSATPPRPDNVSELIGMRAVVTREIDNDAGTGMVRIVSELWSARSAGDPEIAIPVGSPVRIERVDGVIAYVLPVSNG